MRTVTYKEYVLQELPNGWWECWIDGQFIKFDSLEYAISRINYWHK